MFRSSDNPIRTRTKIDMARNSNGRIEVDREKILDPDKDRVAGLDLQKNLYSVEGLFESEIEEETTDIAEGSPKTRRNFRLGGYNIMKITKLAKIAIVALLLAFGVYGLLNAKPKANEFEAVITVKDVNGHKTMVIDYIGWKFLVKQEVRKQLRDIKKWYDNIIGDLDEQVADNENEIHQNHEGIMSNHHDIADILNKIVELQAGIQENYDENMNLVNRVTELQSRLEKLEPLPDDVAEHDAENLEDGLRIPGIPVVTNE
jgi:hypothetical protein